jgi:prevent-host-death family protein
MIPVMNAVTIHQAKTNLSKLIARVEAGEEIVIMRGSTPVARLAAIETKTMNRRFGMLKGKIPNLPDEFFFDPLPEDELRLWEGDSEDPLR